MNKLLKIVGIIAAIGVIGYLFFLFFISPDYDNDKLTLTNNFVENITDETICETHFNPNTEALCTVFKASISLNTSLTHEVVQSGEDVLVTYTDSITEIDIEFEFTFIEEDTTGLKAFFHPKTYLIDLIK